MKQQSDYMARRAAEKTGADEETLGIVYGDMQITKRTPYLLAAILLMIGGAAGTVLLVRDLMLGLITVPLLLGPVALIAGGYLFYSQLKSMFGSLKGMAAMGHQLRTGKPKKR